MAKKQLSADEISEAIETAEDQNPTLTIDREAYERYLTVNLTRQECFAILKRIEQGDFSKLKSRERRAMPFHKETVMAYTRQNVATKPGSRNDVKLASLERDVQLSQSRSGELETEHELNAREN